MAAGWVMHLMEVQWTAGRSAVVSDAITFINDQLVYNRNQ